MWMCAVYQVERWNTERFSDSVYASALIYVFVFWYEVMERKNCYDVRRNFFSPFGICQTRRPLEFRFQNIANICHLCRVAVSSILVSKSLNALYDRINHGRSTILTVYHQSTLINSQLSVRCLEPKPPNSSSDISEKLAGSYARDSYSWILPPPSRLSYPITRLLFSRCHPPQSRHSLSISNLPSA